jgi:hypothetical protein
MSGEQFYINYSLNGEHYIMGPYHTRRFAMSHIDDVRRQPGVSNVFLGNKPPDTKSYRKRVPITKAPEPNGSSKAREPAARPWPPSTRLRLFRE